MILLMNAIAAKPRSGGGVRDVPADGACPRPNTNPAEAEAKRCAAYSRTEYLTLRSTAADRNPKTKEGEAQQQKVRSRSASSFEHAPSE